MSLILTIENEERLPDGGPTRMTVSKRGIDIGRDQFLDWTLTDPSRYISGKHCEIRFSDGDYWLHDVSTNGTFVNGSDRRLPAAHRIRNGDRIMIGHYIIRADVEGEPQGRDEAPPPVVPGNMWAPVGDVAPPSDRSLFEPPRASGPAYPDVLDRAASISAPVFAPEPPPLPPMPAPNAWAAPPPPAAPSPWDLPPAAAPAPPPAAPVFTPPPPPSAPPANAWMTPPPPAASPWDVPPAAPAPEPFAPVPMEPAASSFAMPAEEPTRERPVGWSGESAFAPSPPEPARDAPASPSDSAAGERPDPWSAAAASAPAPAQPPATPTTERVPGPYGSGIAPAMQVVPDAARASDVRIPATAAPPAMQPIQPAAATPVMQPVPPAPPAMQPVPPPAAVPPPAPAMAAPSGQGGREILNRIAAAAGIPPSVIAARDEAELADEIGASLRLVAENLMQLLAARAETKSILRSSERTMIQAIGNNPLKFSPTADDALRIMYGGSTRSYMDYRRTFEESFADLKTHQVSTTSAMQAALEELFQELSPDQIDKSVEGGGGLLGSRKAKLWDTYVERWRARTRRSDGRLVDSFMQIFAECYDRLQRKGR